MEIEGRKKIMKEKLMVLTILAFAYCSDAAVPEWANPAVNSINRLPARTYTVPLSVAQLEAAISAAPRGREMFVNFSFSVKSSAFLLPTDWVVARDQISVTSGAKFKEKTRSARELC